MCLHKGLPTNVKWCFIIEDKVIRIITVFDHVLQHETGIFLTRYLILLIRFCTRWVLYARYLKRLLQKIVHCGSRDDEVLIRS